MNLLSGLHLLAQEGGGLTSGPLGMLPAFAVMAILFYVMLIRPQRREQANRQTMLEGLKKNDHVLTAGGIYGTVASVRREADEVILKVDETSNTKLRVTLSSIQRIVREEPAAEQTVK